MRKETGSFRAVACGTEFSEPQASTQVEIDRGRVRHSLMDPYGHSVHDLVRLAGRDRAIRPALESRPSPTRSDVGSIRNCLKRLSVATS